MLKKKKGHFQELGLNFQAFIEKFSFPESEEQFPALL